MAFREMAERTYKAVAEIFVEEGYSATDPEVGRILRIMVRAHEEMVRLLDREEAEEKSMTEEETAMLVFQTVDAILQKAGYRPGDPRIERILLALIDAHEAMVRHYDPGKTTVQ